MEGEAQVMESSPSEVSPAVVNEASQEQNISHESSDNQINGDAKPSGFDPVDLSPAQQDRFNRVYGNMKRYESDAKELRQINQQLIATVEQLHQGQQQIVSHLQVNDYQEAESRLNEQRDAAWNKGDVKAYNEAMDKLHEVKTQRLLARQQPKTQPVPQVQQSQGVSADRLVNTAIDKGEINNVDANIARSWMSQTDVGGNLLRPWTQPSDSRNYAAAVEAQAVFNNPLFAEKSMAEKLREVDKRMGVQTMQTGGQNVLPAGNLTRPTKTNNIKLSPEIEKLAIRTKFGGPKAKSDNDHVDAWKQAVLKSQTKGAKR